MSKYPAKLDNSISLPDVVDNTTGVTADTVNRLKNAILSIEAELGANPSNMHSTVGARLDAIDKYLENPFISGPFKADGDLSGSSSQQKVVGIQGVLVSSNSPNENDALIFDGYGWIPGAIQTESFSGDKEAGKVLAVNGSLPFNPKIVEVPTFTSPKIIVNDDKHVYLVDGSSTILYRFEFDGNQIIDSLKLELSQLYAKTITNDMQIVDIKVDTNYIYLIIKGINSKIHIMNKYTMLLYPSSSIIKGNDNIKMAINNYSVYIYSSYIDDGYKQIIEKFDAINILNSVSAPAAFLDCNEYSNMYATTTALFLLNNLDVEPIATMIKLDLSSIMTTIPSIVGNNKADVALIDIENFISFFGFNNSLYILTPTTQNEYPIIEVDSIKSILKNENYLYILCVYNFNDTIFCKFDLLTKTYSLIPDAHSGAISSMCLLKENIYSAIPDNRGDGNFVINYNLSTDTVLDLVGYTEPTPTPIVPYISYTDVSGDVIGPINNNTIKYMNGVIVPPYNGEQTGSLLVIDQNLIFKKLSSQHYDPITNLSWLFDSDNDTVYVFDHSISNIIKSIKIDLHLQVDEFTKYESISSFNDKYYILNIKLNKTTNKLIIIDKVTYNICAIILLESGIKSVMTTINNDDSLYVCGKIGLSDYYIYKYSIDNAIAESSVELIDYTTYIFRKPCAEFTSDVQLCYSGSLWLFYSTTIDNTTVIVYNYNSDGDQIGTPKDYPIELTYNLYGSVDVNGTILIGTDAPFIVTLDTKSISFNIISITGNQAKYPSYNKYLNMTCLNDSVNSSSIIISIKTFAGSMSVNGFISCINNDLKILSINDDDSLYVYDALNNTNYSITGYKTLKYTQLDTPLGLPLIKKTIKIPTLNTGTISILVSDISNSAIITSAIILVDEDIDFGSDSLLVKLGTDTDSLDYLILEQDIRGATAKSNFGLNTSECGSGMTESNNYRCFISECSILVTVTTTSSFSTGSISIYLYGHYLI